MSEGMSWDTFLKNAKEIIEICNELGDCWEMQGNENIEGAAYMVKKSDELFMASRDSGSENSDSDSDILPDGWIPASFDTFKPKFGNYLLKFEHHIVYNISYQVPVLAFNAWKPSGELLTLDEAWSMINPIYIQSNMYTALTQMDHPVLQKPFLTLHPCTTNEFISNFDLFSKNPLLTWLSSVGPILHLKLSTEIMNYLDKKMDNTMPLICIFNTQVEISKLIWNLNYYYSWLSVLNQICGET